MFECYPNFSVIIVINFSQVLQMFGSVPYKWRQKGYRGQKAVFLRAKSIQFLRETYGSRYAKQKQHVPLKENLYFFSWTLVYYLQIVKYA